MTAETETKVFFPCDFATLAERKLIPQKKFMPKYPSWDSIPKKYSAGSANSLRAFIYKTTIQELYNAVKNESGFFDVLPPLSSKFENEYGFSFEFYSPVLEDARRYFFYALEKRESLRRFGVDFPERNIPPRKTKGCKCINLYGGEEDFHAIKTKTG